MQTQLIISLVLIGVAAVVALACDFLRSKNAQLRNQMDRLAERGPKIAPGNTAGAQRLALRTDRMIATQDRQASRQIPLQHPAAPVPNVERDNVMPGRSAAESSNRQDRQLMAEVSSVSGKPKANPALTTWLSERAVAKASRIVVAESISAREEPKSTKIDEPVTGAGPVRIDMQVPAGMHSLAVLSKLMESHDPFTGVVISIAVSAKDSHETRNVEIALPVEQLVAGLLRNSDFGCRVDSHEFLLICPDPRTAEAKRHLSHVSEQLWDYQLRALGKSQLVFSIGGAVVQGETVSEAIASAKQRMNQSRRGTSTSSMSLMNNRKKAV